MSYELIQGDCLTVLRGMTDQSVHCCVTSPPYWGLRDYQVEGQIGLEPTMHEYVATLVEVFAEVRRVLRADGTLWLNLGDCYTSGNRTGHGTPVNNKQATNRGNHNYRPPCPKGLKAKDLCGIPWRVAFALQDAGWYLRSDIIWNKLSPMPESVTDRPTRSHEYLFLLSTYPRYYYDAAAIAEPASYAGQPRGGSTQRYEQNAAGMDGKIYDVRNKRSVWSVQPAVFKGAHFATFPTKLVEPCVLAGSPRAGTVLDPFSGAGTTVLVAHRLGRHGIGIELNPEYVTAARERIANDDGLVKDGELSGHELPMFANAPSCWRTKRP